MFRRAGAAGGGHFCYGALNTLQDKGWIEALPCAPGSRKKEYRITAAGRAAVENELARLKELVKNGEQVTGGNPV